jgi:hypothetical protein
MKRLLVVCMVFLLAGSVALAASRTWKSSNGRYSIEAELLDFKDGKIQLKKSDGKVIDVPLVSLCDEDRRFVKQQFPGVEEEKLTPGVEYRQWKSKDGRFSVNAEFLGYEDGKVQLRKSDGTELSVKKDLLSTADQQWLTSELKRQREEDKEGKSTEGGSDEDVAGPIGEQEIPMKLLRLDLPKPKARGRTTTPSSFLFSHISPQQVYVKLGQGEAAYENLFRRAVKTEPSYTSQTPIRGVATLGGRQYGFAIDSVAGKVAGYNKLYFDLNGNGDLTDDKPIAATTASTPMQGMSQSQFPRFDITIDAEGKPVEASLLPSVICRQSGNDSYATVTFYSAAVREGYLTLGKKKTRLLLVDHNSNGRFDDAVAIRPDGAAAEGDLLLINPKPPKRGSSGDLERDRNFVNKTVCLGKDFYRMEIAPAGETLKLTPIKLALGSVVNSSLSYRAMLFSNDFGVIAVGGAKDQKIPLPEGTWKILGYTIQGGSSETIVAAKFDAASPPVSVVKGSTSQLPFGAPLRAVVTAARIAPDKIALSLGIVGVSGERLTNLMVNGKRPPKPQFMIKDKDGKVVHQGSFEYG